MKEEVGLLFPPPPPTQPLMHRDPCMYLYKYKVLFGYIADRWGVGFVCTITDMYIHSGKHRLTKPWGIEWGSDTGVETERRGGKAGDWTPHVWSKIFLE